MTPGRLRESSLPTLAGSVITPRYDRHRTGIGQVHLGTGAFHRAHQAVYTEAALAQFGGDWGICGASLRSPRIRDSLAPQDLLYSVTERDRNGVSRQIIGALRELIFAPEDPASLVQRLADPAVYVVTLTITEKGYGLDPSTGALAMQSIEIQSDLQDPNKPRTAIGYLVAGLRLRRARNAPGLTLLSCDNLLGNGHKLRSAVLEFATVLEPGLPSWIERHCRFPCTMVDRIVPATTARDYREIAAALGVEDRAAVVTEPFRQWVIESDFAGPVPPWDRVGARFVEDVAPFETMKLRLLNASHSGLAYLGCLADFATVADAIAAPGMAALIGQLMLEEIAPTLTDLGDFDVPDYCQALLSRFANPGLEHRTAQIAMDGSQKIPQRVLPPLRLQLQRGCPGEATSLVLAAWMHYLRGRDDSGRELVIDDPMAGEFARIATQHGGQHEAFLDAVLGLKNLFGNDLPRDKPLRESLLHWLRRLGDEGAAGVVAEVWGTRPTG